MFSLRAKKLHKYILNGCITLPVPSYYFWGNSDNFLENTEPENVAGGISLTTVFAYVFIQRNQCVSDLCDIAKHWNCPEVVQTRSDEVCVYIICPFVSTSYLVTVQASPQAWPHFHLCACQQVTQPTNFTVTKAQSWWCIAPNMTPRGDF